MRIDMESGSLLVTTLGDKNQLTLQMLSSNLVHGYRIVCILIRMSKTSFVVLRVIHVPPGL